MFGTFIKWDKSVISLHFTEIYLHESDMFSCVYFPFVLLPLLVARVHFLYFSSLIFGTLSILNT